MSQDVIIPMDTATHGTWGINALKKPRQKDAGVIKRAVSFVTALLLMIRNNHIVHYEKNNFGTCYFLPAFDIL